MIGNYTLNRDRNWDFWFGMRSFHTQCSLCAAKRMLVTDKPRAPGEVVYFEV